MIEKRFHTGGIVLRKPDAPLPEGVVGYTGSGRPVYDGDWFDAKMHPPGTVTVIVRNQ